MAATPSTRPELAWREPFSDPARMGRLHALVEACRANPRPHLRFLPPERARGARRLAVLAGSFNPLTIAHVALADVAERAELGPVAFALSTRTVDKEHLVGALLEDRLLVLELHAEPRPARLVALVNRGLYVEQAALVRAALPRLEALTFVVGFDKIVQIFDPRYYADRDAALERLFGLAGFAVAPRAGAGRPELGALLGRPENRRFADRVRPLEVAPVLAEIAASTLRGALAEGRAIPGGLAPESVAFVEATGCYRPDCRYATRAAWIRGDRNQE